MSRSFEASSMAREALSFEQQFYYSHKAKQAGVYLTASRSLRRDCWKVTVSGHGQFVELFGKGDLGAVIDGAFDDFECLPDEDRPPPDTNREGDPAFNGAFG